MSRKVPYLLDVLDRGAMAAGQVLDQADQHQILPRGVDDDRRDLGLAQARERLHPALSAAQHVARLAVFASARRHDDRLLQADLGDVGDDLPELLHAAHAGVGDGDFVDGDHLHFVVRSVHAASIFLRWAMRVK